MEKEIKTIKGSIQIRNNSYFVLLTGLEFPKLNIQVQIMIVVLQNNFEQ